ncbi:MAG: DegV family protein [Syntrophomonadaceae bacterium]
MEGEKIALLTDSACDLPQEIIKMMNINVVPLKVIYPDKVYSDRFDIQPDEVYSRMPEEIPTTSMPSPEEIRSLVESIRQQGFTHLIALHISSGLSGTYQAVKMVTRDIDNMVIKVVDSKTLSMATGLMVLETARNIARGLSFDKIIDNIYELQAKTRAYYVLETLEYLRLGGRIGKVASMLGEFLHLKPIISVDAEGKYYTYCKAKGRRKSIEKLVQIVEEAIREKPIRLALMNGGSGAEYEAFVERFRKMPNIVELITSDISPALGVHTGPGLLAICFTEV